MKVDVACSMLRKTRGEMQEAEFSIERVGSFEATLLAVDEREGGI